MLYLKANSGIKAKIVVTALFMLILTVQTVLGEVKVPPASSGPATKTGGAPETPPPTPNSEVTPIGTPNSGMTSISAIKIEYSNSKGIITKFCETAQKSGKRALFPNLESGCSEAEKAKDSCVGCPPSYYARNICSTLPELAIDSNFSNSEDFKKLEEACGMAGIKAGGGLDVLGMNIINGFGDYLKERAKEELVVYAADKLGRKICKATQPVGYKAKSPDCTSKFLCRLSPNPTIKSLFDNGCTALFPLGADKDFDYQALVSGPVEKALKDDLKVFPAKIIETVPFCVANKTQCNAWHRVVEVTLATVVDSPRGVSPLNYFRDVAEKIDSWQDDTGKGITDLGTKCNLTDPNSRNLSCVSLFLVEVGREGAAQYEKSAKPDIGAWIETAARNYCKKYGDPQKDRTDCIIDANYTTDWKPYLDKFARSIADLAKVQVAFDNYIKSGKPSTEATTEMLNLIIGAFEASLDVYANVLGRTANGESQQKQIISLVRSATNTAAALAKKDKSELQSALMKLTASTAGFEDFPQGITQSVRFAANLSATNSREEVKQVIEEAAAPVGSYQNKFKVEGGTKVTLNAFVGPFFGYQQNFHRANSGNPKQDDFVTRLAAPVGIDWVFGRTTTGSNTFAAGITAIDPLAFIAVQGDGNTVKAKWETILAPGAYVRWGIGRSPITLMLGWTYLPGLESKEDCGGSACWKGAHQVGATVAVDLPLLFLY